MSSHSGNVEQHKEYKLERGNGCFVIVISGVAMVHSCTTLSGTALASSNVSDPI